MHWFHCGPPGGLGNRFSGASQYLRGWRLLQDLRVCKRLINTPLQRGGGVPRKVETVLTVSIIVGTSVCTSHYLGGVGDKSEETVGTVSCAHPLVPTPLKRGVNERTVTALCARAPAPELVFRDGKDAFHRVPFIPGEVRDAVERVLTRFGGARRVNRSGGSLPAVSSRRGERERNCCARGRAHSGGSAKLRSSLRIADRIVL